MMLNNNRDQPQHWRERAENALTDAESASDLAVKAKLLGVARAYDVIAERAVRKIKLGGALGNQRDLGCGVSTRMS
jgi:hypothetical protein